MVNLRQATPEDAKPIALLHADSWRRTYRGALPDAFLDGEVESDRLALWHDRLAAPAEGEHTVVAEESDGIEAFAHTVADDDPEWGALLGNIHVSVARRGQGLGAQLMTDAAVWVDGNGRRKSLYLWVLEQNTGAQRFYRRLGGEPAGREM
ncbi:MAG: GNAT family N-acetyltransferase, partial [Acidimicrobiales bacterium]